MDSRATQQCNMYPYVYSVYWLPSASSGFLLARKCNQMAKKMLITCMMQNARAHKLQWSGPTVHSSTVVLLSTSGRTQQCNMCPYVYAVYWLPSASSGFLLARKCNRLAKKMLITCAMRNARAHKLQWSGPTVHSSTIVLLSTSGR